MTVKKSQYPRPAVLNAPRTVVMRERTTNSAINDALGIIGAQLDLLKVKASFGAGLEDAEVKNLRIFVQSLTDLRRDEREQDKHDKVDETSGNMTNAELVKILLKDVSPDELSELLPLIAAKEPKEA